MPGRERECDGMIWLFSVRFFLSFTMITLRRMGGHTCRRPLSHAHAFRMNGDVSFLVRYSNESGNPQEQMREYGRATRDPGPRTTLRLGLKLSAEY